MNTIKELIRYLEQLAPPVYQESYDNSGLLTGDEHAPLKGVLFTLDATEAVITEALERGCNLVVAHHPIIFGGLKRLTGRTYAERAVLKAIRNDIAIYAIHTNLDKVIPGVNGEICRRLGLEQTRILVPERGHLKKLTVFVPNDRAETVRQAMFLAGAGQIGKYDSCSYNVQGEGTFRALEGAQPHVGSIRELHYEAETRIEVIFPAYLEQGIVRKMIEAHPYEEVAYFLHSLDNYHLGVGLGMIGVLPEALPVNTFLQHVKDRMELTVLKHTAFQGPVRKVAVCGGAGISLLKHALHAGADAYITSDIKYHEFFDAEQQLLLADIGHYESERFTPQLLMELVQKKFSTFALLISNTNTNPVQYF